MTSVLAFETGDERNLTRFMVEYIRAELYQENGHVFGVVVTIPAASIAATIIEASQCRIMAIRTKAMYTRP